MNPPIKKRLPQAILNYQFLIRKYVKPERFLSENPHDFNSYPKSEYKIAKILLQKYTIDFWLRTELPFKLNSLAWFLTSNGKEFLSEEIKKVKIDQVMFDFDAPNQSNKISNRKFGENISQKPKQEFLDFLDS